MPRTRMPAGRYRERVVFQRQARDADGYPTGGFDDVWACAAAVETSPGPMRVAALRLEGRNAIVVTVRSNEATRAIAASAEFRLTWRRYEGRTYMVEQAEETPDRREVTIWAAAPVGGAGA